MRSLGRRRRGRERRSLRVRYATGPRRTRAVLLSALAREGSGAGRCPRCGRRGRRAAHSGWGMPPGGWAAGGGWAAAPRCRVARRSRRGRLWAGGWAARRRLKKRKDRAPQEEKGGIEGGGGRGEHMLAWSGVTGWAAARAAANHLGYISATSRLHLGYISPPARQQTAPRPESSRRPRRRQRRQSLPLRRPLVPSAAPPPPRGAKA